MDPWILKQLRGRVISDLGNLIPQGHFNTEVPWAVLNKGFENSKYLSYELKWGYLAGTLGQELYFRPTELMSARQVSAAEMLMHLGLLAAMEASHASCSKLAEMANALGVPDGNSKVVSKQMHSEGLPLLRKNVLGGLQQYLKHLSKDEAAPFSSLLQTTEIGLGKFL